MNIFIVLMIVYILMMLILGYVGSKRATNSTSYATSNGDVSVFNVSITFAATFASAGTFLGVAGQGFAYGITNIWFWASQWTAAGIVMAIIAIRYRRMNKNKNSATVADWIGDRFGSQGLRVWMAIISLFQIAFIASQLVGAGIIINQMIPAISYEMGVLISAIVIIIYISMGGSYAHIYTNVAQGTMMMILGVVLAISGFVLFGNIFTEVPAQLAAIDPNLAAPLNPANGGYPAVIHVVGLFVAHLWWALNPQLINKATYLKSDRDVKKFCWMAPLFMFLMCSVVLVGSYTRILVPEGLGATISGMDGAVPYYVNLIFPKVIAAIFLVVIMAAMMSTVDGVLLYVASILGCTLYKNTYIPHKKAKGFAVDDAKVEKTTMRILKYSTIVIGLIAVPIAFSKPANLTAMLWGAAGPIMSAIAGPVIIGVFSKRASAKAAGLGSIVGALLFVILYFGNIMPSVYLCCGVCGLVSVVLCAIGTKIFKPMAKEEADKIFKVVDESEEELAKESARA